MLYTQGCCLQKFFGSPLGSQDKFQNKCLIVCLSLFWRKYFFAYGRWRAFSILVSEVQNEQGIFNVLRSLEVSLRTLVTRLGSLFEILVAREQIVGASGDWAPI